MGQEAGQVVWASSSLRISNVAAHAAQDLKDTTNEENLRLADMNGREVAYMLPLLL